MYMSMLDHSIHNTGKSTIFVYKTPEHFVHGTGQSAVYVYENTRQFYT